MLKKCVVFFVLAMSLVAFSSVEIAFAETEWPSWSGTENFVPPKDAKKAKKFEGTLSFTTTPMNVTTEPEDPADVLWEGDYRYPWALYDFWWYPAFERIWPHGKYSYGRCR